MVTWPEVQKHQKKQKPSKDLEHVEQQKVTVTGSMTCVPSFRQNVSHDTCWSRAHVGVLVTPREKVWPQVTWRNDEKCGLQGL